ncbi:MAG: SPOR domain-containing protein [Spirochaetaceae bacterium]|jgi:cell division protein FtsN|nr:SPOR domain-containing protein [Spirochaetaceae bacterium]
MEEKRILWIAAAVGMFLLVVIGAALILYTPGKEDEPAVASSPFNGTIWMGGDAETANGAHAQTAQSGAATAETPQAVQPYQPGQSAQPYQLFPYTQPGQSAQAVQPYQPGQAAQPYQPGQPGQSAQAAQPYQPGQAFPPIQLFQTFPPAQPAPATAQAQVTVGQTGDSPQGAGAKAVTIYADSTNIYTERVDLNNPRISQESAPQPVKPENAAARDALAQGRQAGPKAPSSASKARAAAAQAEAEKTRAVAASIPKAKPVAQGSQFWVQTAAYTTRKYADNAREALSSNKIPCEVFTHADSRGKVYYRVRVGPYSTKSEAEYWQSRIAQIEQFSRTQSFVTNAAAKSN